MGKQKFQIVSTAMQRHCQIFQYLIKNSNLDFWIFIIFNKIFRGHIQSTNVVGRDQKRPKNCGHPQSIPDPSL